MNTKQQTREKQQLREKKPPHCQNTSIFPKRVISSLSSSPKGIFTSATVRISVHQISHVKDGEEIPLLNIKNK